MLHGGFSDPAPAGGCGGSRPRSGPGPDRALTGRQQTPHEFLYWELPRYNGKTGTFFEKTPMQAARRRDWKAVRPRPNGPLELYNLKDDIGETRDLAASKPRVLAQFEAFLKTARVEPRPQRQPPQRDFPHAR